MTNNHRVFNLTRNFSMKFKQAQKAVDNCAASWVEYGVSIRDLTLAESITRRIEQAKLHGPMETAEIPGLIYEPPSRYGNVLRRELIHAANAFAAAAGV